VHPPDKILAMPMAAAISYMDNIRHATALSIVKQVVWTVWQTANVLTMLRQQYTSLLLHLLVATLRVHTDDIIVTQSYFKHINVSTRATVCFPMIQTWHLHT